MLRFLRGANKRTKTIWWVLIVVTVVTFVGGFVFLLGAELTGSNAAMVGDVGAVNGSARSGVMRRSRVPSSSSLKWNSKPRSDTAYSNCSSPSQARPDSSLGTWPSIGNAAITA